MAAVALIAAAALAGCDSVRLLNDYRVVESPDMAAQPWPRLVDVPAAPAPGSYSADVPDPAGGGTIAAVLSERAATAAARRERLAAPVLVPAERARLGR